MWVNRVLGVTIIMCLSGTVSARTSATYRLDIVAAGGAKFVGPESKAEVEIGRGWSCWSEESTEYKTSEKTVQENYKRRRKSLKISATTHCSLIRESRK